MTILLFSGRVLFLLGLTLELVGQLSGIVPWGPALADLSAGDFNLISFQPAAPRGTGTFRLPTNGGNGDYMVLPGLAPIPEPSEAALCLPGTVGMYRGRRRPG